MAANRMTVAKGTLRHTLTMHREAMAYFGSTGQGIGSIPIHLRMMLRRPLLVLYTNCQTTAITTDDTARGRKIIVRKMAIPFIFRLSTPATARLMSTVGTTVPTV